MSEKVARTDAVWSVLVGPGSDLARTLRGAARSRAGLVGPGRDPAGVCAGLVGSGADMCGPARDLARFRAGTRDMSRHVAKVFREKKSCENMFGKSGKKKWPPRKIVL